MSMRYHARLIIGSLMFLAATVAQAADRVISFIPEPSGLASRLVYDHWMHSPEFADYTKTMDMPPSYMLARGDLNGDKSDEIFARVSDMDLADYCPNFGSECVLLIYKLDKGHLVEIGRMFSAKDVIVLPAMSKGYHNLRVERANKVFTEYRWDGQAYKEK